MARLKPSEEAERIRERAGLTPSPAPASDEPVFPEPALDSDLGEGAEPRRGRKLALGRGLSRLLGRQVTPDGCAVCNEPILEGQPMVRRDGVTMHARCSKHWPLVRDRDRHPRTETK